MCFDTPLDPCPSTFLSSSFSSTSYFFLLPLLLRLLLFALHLHLLHSCTSIISIPLSHMSPPIPPLHPFPSYSPLVTSSSYFIPLKTHPLHHQHSRTSDTSHYPLHHPLLLSHSIISIISYSSTSTLNTTSHTT